MSASSRRLSLLGLAIALLAAGVVLALRAEGPAGDELPVVPAAEGAAEDPHLAGRGQEAGPANAPAARRLDGTCQVHGFVRDEAGVGLAGIPVELTVQEDRPWGSYREWFLRVPVEDPIVAVTTTDADGSFTFEGARSTVTYRVHARPAPPCYPMRGWALTHLLHGEEPVLLVVGEGAPLRLRVVDAEGQGRVAFCFGSLQERRVVNGRVRPLRWEGGLGTTDADGRLTSPVVPHGRMELSLFVSGFMERSGFVVEVPAREEVVLRLEEPDGATVVGRVRDEERRLIADAWIHVGIREQGARRRSTSRGVATDAAGHFRVGGLPVGTLERLVVEAPGFLQCSDAAENVSLLAGEPLHVDVALTRGCALEGVVRGPDGQPVAGARVQATSAPTTGSYFTSRTDITVDGTSDVRGRYRLDALPVLRGTVEAVAEGCYTTDEEGLPGGRSFSLAAPGDVRQVDLVLARGVRVVGHVVDEAGGPVPGLEVWAHTRSGSGPSATCITDASGGFLFEGLAPGRTWSFQARTERGRAEEVVLRLEPDAAEAEVKLVWREAAEISGRVVYDGESADFPGRVQCRSGRRGGPGFSRAWPVAADGTFHLPGIPPGRHELSVVDYSLDRNGEAVRVEVQAGQRLDGILLRARRMGEIAGVVVDERGVPQSDCWVGLEPAEDRHTAHKQEMTDDDGLFHFPEVPDVGHVLLLDGIEQPGSVHIGDVTLRLVLPGGEDVVCAGTVRGPDGELVPRATVRIVQYTERGSSDADEIDVREGRFRQILELRGDRIDVQVHRALDAEGEDLHTRPYEQTDVDPRSGPIHIRLEPGLVIAGRVEGPPATWLAGRFLEAQLGVGEGRLHYVKRFYEIEIQGDGAFRLEGLEPGRYRIGGSIEEGADWVPGPPIHAEAGDRDAVLHFLPAVSVRGSVTDAEGVPVGRAALHLYWSWEAGGSTSRSALSDVAGRFVLSAVPRGVQGTLHVRAQAEPNRPLLAAKIELTADAEREVAVRLEPGALIRGTLTDEAGETISLSGITATSTEDATATWHAMVLDGDPHFVLGPLPPGHYRVDVDPCPGWEFGDDVVVEAPAQDVRLVVTRAGR